MLKMKKEKEIITTLDLSEIIQEKKMIPIPNYEKIKEKKKKPIRF